jgi:hypothetical protein
MFSLALSRQLEAAPDTPLSEPRRFHCFQLMPPAPDIFALPLLVATRQTEPFRQPPGLPLIGFLSDEYAIVSLRHYFAFAG